MENVFEEICLDEQPDKTCFKPGDQDLGEEFVFEMDGDALKSIIENRGISQPQRYEVQQSMTKNVPSMAGHHAEDDKFEFYQGKGGQVFFRRKVLTPVENTATNHWTLKPVENTATNPWTLKPERYKNSPRSIAKNEYNMSLKPVRSPRSIAKNEYNMSLKPVRFKDFQTKEQPCRSARKENYNPVLSAQTEKKAPRLHFAPNKLSISEQKPRNLLPQQADRSLARKSLHFGKSKTGLFKEPKVPGDLSCSVFRRLEDEGTGQLKKGSDEHGTDLPLPSLIHLTRESARFLPRESLAWISQLPRDSATFQELEKMMGEKDKELINEDDTFSFEALESRLKTPLRLATVSRFNQAKDDECLKSSPGLETSPPPAATEGKESKKDVSSELRNLPSNPILATPTIKSRSMSNLAVPEWDSVPVGRAQSDESLNCRAEASRLISAEELYSILQDLERHRIEQDELRIEQDELEKQQQILFEKIRVRKRAFKELWGVSPMSINRIRTVLPIKLTPTPTSDIRKPEVFGVDTETPEVFGVDTETPEVFGGDTPAPEERKVRFNSGNNESKFITPESSFETSPFPRALSGNSSFSNQSFISLKSSFSFLQTPRAGVSPHPKKGLLQRFHDSRDRGVGREELGAPVPAGTVEFGVPTPVALKSLSARVREEYALLYADTSDDSEEIPNNTIKKLNF